MFGLGAHSEFAHAQAFSGVNVNTANRLSQFNFCDPFDHVLPPVDGTISALDRQHLWGLYTGIAAGGAGGWLNRNYWWDNK